MFFVRALWKIISIPKPQFWLNQTGFWGGFQIAVEINSFIPRARQAKNTPANKY